MAKIVDIEGIGETFAGKLKSVGISTTANLLEKYASAKGRKAISEQTGISDSLLLEWVNHADLYRIKGVGSEYADLLEEAGVDSVPELAQRKADNLYQKMMAINTKKKLVRKLPVQSQVEGWVNQAKHLSKIVTH